MENNTKRLNLIDTIRGFTILSMIGFHACWDIYYFNLGITYEDLSSTPFYIWQQSICWSFILISGYCFSLGHHHLKRSALCLGGGVLITLVTGIVVSDQIDIFGVLWLLGISGFIMIIWDKLRRVLFKDNKYLTILGFWASVFLFILFRNVNSGYLGFEGFNILRLPKGLYNGYFMTLLGFTMPGFFSSDYFSVLPWFFLYSTGYYLRRIMKDGWFENKILTLKIKPFSLISSLGRHSFIVYILHQVVLFALFYVINVVID